MKLKHVFLAAFFLFWTGALAQFAAILIQKSWDCIISIQYAINAEKSSVAVNTIVQTVFPIWIRMPLDVILCLESQHGVG